MHSFHQSRGRIFFESVCALTVSASCVGAWMELGVPAFLPAAAATALYGLWHLTDMRRPAPVLGGNIADAAPADESQGDLLTYVSAEPEPEREPEVLLEVVQVEPKPAPKAKRPKRKKPPAREIAADLSREAPETDETVVQMHEPPESDEEHHAPIVPLFEAQPVVRAPRPVFGRKAG